MTASAPAEGTAPTQAELETARELTKKWVGFGWASFVVVFTSAWFLVPRAAAIEAPLDRLVLALQLTAAPAAILMLVLQGLWRMQDTLAAENPLLGRESSRFKINQRVMTNTVEQMLIFAPMFVALSIRMRPDQTFLLPLLMGFWCVARLMFWAGYHRAFHLRAPGMDWTSGTATVTAFLLAKSLF